MTTLDGWDQFATELDLSDREKAALIAGVESGDANRPADNVYLAAAEAWYRAVHPRARDWDIATYVPVLRDQSGFRAAVDEAVRLTEQRLDASEDHRIATLTAERDELLAALREANDNRAQMTRAMRDILDNLADKARERRDFQARAESAEARYDQVRRELDAALCVVEAAEAWLDAAGGEPTEHCAYELEAAVMAYRVKESPLTADELLASTRRENAEVSKGTDE